MLLDDVRALKETCWRNPKELPFAEAMKTCPLNRANVEDAAARLGLTGDGSDTAGNPGQ